MISRRTMIGAGAAALLPGTAVASPADLAGDIAILRQALALHPGLYRYASPREVEARIAALEPAYVAAPNLEARYLLLSRFLATIRCGHSYCNFFNQRKAVAAALFDRPTRLPFHFRWIDGRMFVLADHSGTGALPPGTEVARINGVPARVMLAALMPYARADGGNDAKRVSLLEVRGGDGIEFFDVFQGLLFPPAGGQHRLDVVGPGGKRRRIEVPAIGLAARRAADPSARAEPWSWAMRPDGVALLTMPGWGLYNSSWDWRGWLDERLSSLTGARGLVIDLRDNEGGLDCGDDILAQLASADLTFDDGEQRLRFRRTPAELDPHLDTWDQSFRTLGEGGQPLGEGWYLRPGQRAITTIPARAPRLTLPVAALVGPVNSSATFGFAEKAKRTGLVRLFGETTGGNRRGINGGCFFFVRLPASGIEFDLPLVGYFPKTPQPDAGIAPDVMVRPTIANLIAGRDRALEAAVAWCRTS
jgi:hypothetical protein